MTVIQKVRGTSPCYGLDREDVVAILHRYVGMGHSDAVLATERFGYLCAKITGYNELNISQRTENGESRKLDRTAADLTGRLALEAERAPSLEKYLEVTEAVGSEATEVAIDGNYTHPFDRGMVPIILRKARAGYFGSNLLAHIMLSREMEIWQRYGKREKQHNPIKHESDFTLASQKLLVYESEFSRLLSELPLEYPPSKISSAERAFMHALKHSFPHRLALFLGDN